jgi:elongation factor 1-beta
MTEVLVTLKVFPEGDEVDLNNLIIEIKKKLPAQYRILKTSTEPIAFGLNALILFITMPEETEGGTESLEELINNIQGVSHAEVINITRLGF